MTAPDDRKRLIRQVHAEARRLGIDTDERKALQIRATGKESCADMTGPELRAVVAALGEGRDRLPDHAPAKKLQALWISAYHLGIVHDRTDRALCAWLRRQCKIDAAQRVTAGRAAKAVEAMRLWLAREAKVDWSPYVAPGRDGVSREVDNPRARVLEAQWRLLHKLGVVLNPDLGALASYATQYGRLPHAGSHSELSDERTIALMQDLGQKIREAQAKRGGNAKGREA